MSVPAERTRDVPCDSCTACCEHELIILHPDCGDDPATYKTRRVKHPLTGEPALALKQNEAGGCVYLQRGIGCAIHDRRPAICREFDCRRLVRTFGVVAALKRAATGDEVVRAGLSRLQA